MRKWIVFSLLGVLAILLAPALSAQEKGRRASKREVVTKTIEIPGGHAVVRIEIVRDGKARGDAVNVDVECRGGDEGCTSCRGREARPEGEHRRPVRNRTFLLPEGKGRVMMQLLQGGPRDARAGKGKKKHEVEVRIRKGKPERCGGSCSKAGFSDWKEEMEAFLSGGGGSGCEIECDVSGDGGRGCDCGEGAFHGEQKAGEGCRERIRRKGDEEEGSCGERCREHARCGGNRCGHHRGMERHRGRMEHHGCRGTCRAREGRHGSMFMEGLHHGGMPHGGMHHPPVKGRGSCECGHRCGHDRGEGGMGHGRFPMDLHGKKGKVICLIVMGDGEGHRFSFDADELPLPLKEILRKVRAHGEGGEGCRGREEGGCGGACRGECHGECGCVGHADARDRCRGEGPRVRFRVAPVEEGKKPRGFHEARRRGECRGKWGDEASYKHPF